MKHTIYRFKASLHGLSTRIWRRFDIDRDTKLAGVAYALMTMFEMRASHLFRFEVAKGRLLLSTLRRFHPNFDTKAFDRDHPDIKNMRVSYELIDLDPEWSVRRGQIENVATTPLGHAVSAVGETMVFEYDFGDGWIIDLKVEGIHETETAAKLVRPTVLEGKGYGIIEDAGGIGGLLEVADAWAKGSGAAYEDMKRWLDIDHFDLDAFDVLEMNLRLEVIPAIYRRIYEHRTEPTTSEIELIERRNSSRSKTNRSGIVK